MESTPPVPATESSPAPPRRRRKFRLLKAAAIIIVVLALLIAALPTLASTGFVRGKVESTLAESLGVPVKLASYSLGWFSGLRVDGLAIDNPSGHPQDRKLLSLEQLEGDLSLTALLLGKIDLQGTVIGLDVLVHQKPDGTLNVQALGKGGEVGVEERESEGGPTDLTKVRLDLKLVGANVQIENEQTGVLETLRNLNATVAKPYGTSDVRLTLDTELHGPKAMEVPGRVALQLDLDANLERPVVVDFDMTTLDLARYRPLLVGMLGPDQLTAFEGRFGGTLEARVDVQRKHLALGGKLQIERPHFAGPIMQDMNLQAERWIVEPNLRVTFHDGDAPPELDTAGLHVDLGFLKLDGVPAAEARTLTGDRPAVAATFAVDVAALTQIGGPVPVELRDSSGSVNGKVAFVTVAEAFDPEHLAEHFADYVNASAKVDLDRYPVQGNELTNVVAKLDVKDGSVHLDGNAELNGGTATIVVDTDLHEMKSMPGKVQISVKDAKIGDTAVSMLRYAVPLLAGLDVTENLDFSSRITTDLSFAGPLLRGGDQTVLQWLNDWRGAGDLALNDGGFTPASQFSELFKLAGQPGRVAFDAITTNFKMAEGAIATSLLKLDGKAQKLGLTGRTTLSGDLDYTIDLRDLIAKQKYGEQILQALGGNAPAGRLAGSLDGPRLELPDIGKLAADAAGNAATKAAEDALQKAAPKGLTEGLNKLLKPPKKKI